MTNVTFCGNRHINLGFSIFGHIGFYGIIPRWGISQLGISLNLNDLVCFSINYVR